MNKIIEVRCVQHGVIARVTCPSVVAYCIKCRRWFNRDGEQVK